MKTDKNTAIHDDLEEKFNMLFGFFSDSGEKINLIDCFFAGAYFICLGIYLFLDFKIKTFFTLIPLAILLILIFIYYYRVTNQTSQYYKNGLHFIPSNYNAFPTFYSKCTFSFSKPDLLTQKEYLDAKIDDYKDNSIIGSAIIAIVSTFLLNSLPTINTLLQPKTDFEYIYYLLQSTIIFSGVYIILSAKKRNLLKLKFYVAKTLLQMK